MSLNRARADQPASEVAASAVLIGQAHLGAGALLAQGVALRSRAGSVALGNHSAVLENGVLVGWPEHPVAIGQRTVFGHRATIVGARLGQPFVPTVWLLGRTMIPEDTGPHGWHEAACDNRGDNHRWCDRRTDHRAVHHHQRAEPLPIALPSRNDGCDLRPATTGTGDHSWGLSPDYAGCCS
jgi:hypothetical protein